MKGEQAIYVMYWGSDAYPTLAIQMAIRVEIPGEQDASVSTSLLFEPELPEHLRDMLYRSLYDGVHGGLLTVGSPVPAHGITVKVLQLHILPLPGIDSTKEEIEHLRDILHTLMQEMVAALWAGLRSLETS